MNAITRVWVLGVSSKEMDQLEVILRVSGEYVEYAMSDDSKRCEVGNAMSAHCENIRGCSYEAIEVECFVDVLDGHVHEGIDYGGLATHVSIEGAFDILGVCPECFGRGYATGNGGNSGYEGPCHAGPYAAFDWTPKTVSEETLKRAWKEWEILSNDLYEHEGANTYGKEEKEREIAVIQQFLKMKNGS